MEFIREIFSKLDAFVGRYLNPILAKISAFLGSGSSTVIAIILVFATILVLVGLLRWLKKAPKLFFFVVIIFGLIIGAWAISRN